MHDSNVSASQLRAVCAWTACAALIVGAWAAYFFGDDDLSRVLGFTGCSVSAVAAVCQVRCYLLRTVRMVLAAVAEQQGGDAGPSVRSLRR